MLDRSQLSDADYARKAAIYLESSQSQHTETPHRPEFVPSRIRLARRVSGDWPVGHMIVADAGDYAAECNQWGAVSVVVSGVKLGIMPDEMIVLEWTENTKRTK